MTDEERIQHARLSLAFNRAINHYRSHINSFINSKILPQILDYDYTAESDENASSSNAHSENMPWQD